MVGHVEMGYRGVASAQWCLCRYLGQGRFALRLPVHMALHPSELEDDGFLCTGGSMSLQWMAQTSGCGGVPLSIGDYESAS